LTEKSRHHEDRAVTIMRVGTNQKYADGWDVAFGGKRGAGGTTKKKPAPSKKAAAKKSTKKARR
jgi:hypothetical protein